MSRIILMVKADRDKLRLLNTRCTVLVCTVNPHNSRIEGSSNFQNHSFQFGNNRLDVKLWFPLEMVDSACTSWFSLYEKVWSRMHEKRERTCPVYQKVPFVPPFFAEREKKTPPNRRFYETPGPGLLLPLVRTLHLSCRRRGRFVPLPETVFNMDGNRSMIERLVSRDMPRKSRNCLDIRRIIGIQEIFSS